jgi:acetyl esterase/lipase
MKSKHLRLLTILMVAALLIFAAAVLLQQSASSHKDIMITRDVDYIAGTDYAEDKDKLDVFMPKAAAGAAVIVFFHGGSLQQGDKSHGELLAMRFVPAGVGVVSANYRLLPGVMHPTHIQDAAAAFTWVIKNIERYGGDPERVYVSGHSAGAYLAALMALDQVWLAAHGFGLDAIRGTIAISPFLYVEETAKGRPKTVWGEDPKAWMNASVTPHIEPGKGPMLLIYADGDAEWRRDQNDNFGEAMRSAGNREIRVVEVPNRDHTTILTQINTADDRIGELVLQFIKGWEKNVPQD